MTLAVIRDRYRVPAWQHRTVRFRGRPGTILSAAKDGLYLWLRMEDGDRVMVHPTWEIDYLDGRGVR